MSHYLKLLLRDVFAPNRCRWDDGRKQYCIGNPIQFFTRVRIMGTVRACGTSALELDDGTAVIAVQFSTQMRFRPGDLVDCLGELQPSRQALRSTYVLASHILPVQDPNMETLRFLEVIHLYKASYFSGQPPVTASELGRPLPAVPSAVVAGIKRKFATHALEYLFDGGTSQKHHRTSPNNSGDEYFFTVPDIEAARLATGVRRLELRVNKPPYSVIVQGDTILFNGVHVLRVKAVRNYATLATALEAEHLALLLPHGVDASHALEHFKSLASDADVRAFGVAVFEFEDRSAAESSRAAACPSDPGTAVQALLEETSMTFDDLVLRLAPAHGAPDISSILDELQVDGVIYQLPSGHYALL
ncbi:hypothetical protein, variant 1 [Aphanomyces invadans]|uniref:OB domain-containing protein n=1 Tax=Aphanomyces invadans TaxID=157072 RepID=A0A024TNP7_9STRA|nr:hypothetical protein, variant 1 [Aphanomyces invadans]ETV95634.1 hypothetical protein, variant 1 [Aphanomyces invadans]|eukprot:XP_008875827.1 hypothetical protein, variant 1 [Aphanomyces invadans]